MNADVIVTVHGRDPADFGRKVEAIDAIARAPQEIPPGPTIPPVILPPIGPPVPVPPKPYFDIGDGRGKAGDTVELIVEAGCRFQTNGFHIGGGCGLLEDVPQSGYGRFEATGAKIGKFLWDYFKTHGLIKDNPAQSPLYHHDFQMVKHNSLKPLPEEWWQYTVLFFSITPQLQAPPTQIPSGTELFTVKIKILPGTPPGEYTVTCLDEYYYTHSRPRRRDWMFTGEVSGGYTKLDLRGGKITVT